MIDFTEQIRDDLRALVYDVYRRLEAWLEPFADDLQEFLSTLLKSRLPPDWRERWHAFVDESAAKGFVVQPQSIVELEAWIAAWARRRRLLPEPLPAERPQLRTASGELDPRGQGDPDNDGDEAPRGEPILQHPKGRGAHPQDPQQGVRPTQTQIREQFFNDKLGEAQRCLDEINRVLDALGDELDAAKVDEKTEVEDEADAVEEFIFRYNDALESARDAWLRDDLSGEANARLLSLFTPRCLGLPAFVDDGQAVRAQKQERAISQRLAERDVTMDRIVFAAQTVEWAGTAAGIALGGGVVLKAAQSGGKWAVVRTLAVTGAAMVGEQAVERSLRAVGVNEQTIRGFRLAALVVAFIIHRRKNASASSKPPANTSPSGNAAPPASTPPPPPAKEQRPAIRARLGTRRERSRMPPAPPARRQGLRPPSRQRQERIQSLRALAERINETTNAKKGYGELLEQWLYPSYITCDSILQRYNVGVISPQNPPECPHPINARQGHGVFVSDMDGNSYVGSSGAGPCIILVIKGPGQGFARAWHFDAEDDIPTTLQRDLGPVPNGHAGIAGNDDTSTSNFNLAVLLNTLKDLGIAVDGYYKSDELWSDSNGKWVVERPR